MWPAISFLKSKKIPIFVNMVKKNSAYYDPIGTFLQPAWCRQVEWIIQSQWLTVTDVSWTETESSYLAIVWAAVLT